MGRAVIQIRRWLVLAWVLLLSACSATGPQYSEVASSIPTLKSGDGRIYFFRSSSMMGAAIQPEIRLDGVVVGKSQPGSFFYVDRPAGVYSATATTEVEARITVDLKAGETQYISSSIGFGVLVGRVNFSLQPEITARSEMSSLAYTGVSPLSPSAARGATATPSATAPPPSATTSPGSRGGQVSMDDLRGLLPKQP